MRNTPKRTVFDENGDTAFPLSIKKQAFTLFEMLVVIAIVLVLAAILFPAYQRAQDQTKEATCLSNVKTVMSAVTSCLADNGGIAPDAYQPGAYINPDDYYYNRLYIPRYLNAELRCPAIPKNYPRNALGFRYAINNAIQSGYPTLQIPVPSSRCVMVSEMYYFGDGLGSCYHLCYTAQGTATGGVIQEHFKGLNLGFFDGHAELVKPPLDDQGIQHWEPWSPNTVYAKDYKTGYYYDATQWYCIYHGYTSW